MVQIRPFRALRPRVDVAARVSSVPYDVVTGAEARSLAAAEPLSFLHVTRAEVDLPADADPYATQVYEAARHRLEELRADGTLLLEEAPSIYVYRLRMGDHEQVGVAAGYSVDEYERDVVKKHEKTRRDKEDDRTRHICTVRAQTGVVFLTHRPEARVFHATERVVATPPLYDFTSEDGVQHTVWRAAPAECDALVAAFDGLDALYIADGHHRAASAARARRELADHPGAAMFLAVAFPADRMNVLPYNRLVADLRGRTPEAFLAELANTAAVSPGAPVPRARGRVSMYLAGGWYEVVLPPPAASAGAVERLDVSVLQDRILAPLLGIGDPRTDSRIDFVGGIRGTAPLERAVRDGAAAVAFSLAPVTVDELMDVSDAGAIMPPKSTWFEPKLRDGLLVHLV